MCVRQSRRAHLALVCVAWLCIFIERKLHITAALCVTTLSRLHSLHPASWSHTSFVMDFFSALTRNQTVLLRWAVLLGVGTWVVSAA